jgi:hypothetical protein
MATKRTPPVKRFLAAIESGDTKLVERLIAKGANVSGELWNETPASCAIHYGHPQILEILIRHGLDPRSDNDHLFSLAVHNEERGVLKFLCATVFAPDLWRGKTRAEIENAADAIYRNFEKEITFELTKQWLQIARIELIDAAMTCWERVRPDPPKINISKIPAKGKPV